MTTSLLAFNTAATIYLVVGSLHEEARLREAFGDKYDAYLSSGADPRDPRISPWRADLRGFPPACCIVGNADPIVDQTLRMHDALRTAGNSSTLHRYDDMPHAFLQFPDLPEVDQALAVACAFLRTHCGN